MRLVLDDINLENISTHECMHLSAQYQGNKNKCVQKEETLWSSSCTKVKNIISGISFFLFLCTLCKHDVTILFTLFYHTLNLEILVANDEQ